MFILEGKWETEGCCGRPDGEMIEKEIEMEESISLAPFQSNKYYLGFYKDLF